METLLEYERTQELTATREAELHNAGIKERYRRLRDAEERQFGENTTTETNATDYTVRASVLAPERPVVSAPTDVQAPTVTEYVRKRVESPVFTTEKFNALPQETPVSVQAPVEIPTAQAPVATVAVATEAQYSLSQMAKTVMAAVAALVVMMLVAICINTHIINVKTAQLQALETRQAELTELNTEIQNRIQKAKSEQSIREYAESQGMIESGR